ncbi:MAG: hypothetical protein NT007_08880 [Candidatus Kapabacteria bacterium]|nr:hypothetical protein [Candidatus Kapabacteria bacterium]
MYRFRIISFFTLITALVALNSCFIVKRSSPKDENQIISISPKPEIQMSEDIIRSKNGDILAFLPKSWFLVELSEKLSNDIFAVAVNPDYTLTAVFSIIKNGDAIDQVVTKEGLSGLARMCLAKHERKTGGGIKQVGTFSQLQVGKKSFVEFDFQSMTNPLVTRSAVFISSVNQYYQFALIPTEITGKELPSKEETDKIFRSFLISIDF